MKNGIRKIIAGGLLTCVLVGAVGCGQNNDAVSVGNGEMPKELTIFAPIGSYTLRAGATDNNDMLPFQMIEEITGCKVEWIHPAVGGQEEKFNLLIASDNVPDLMVYNWRDVSGGAKLFAEDGIIVPMGDLITNYMPNLSAFLTERPEIKKQFSDDVGNVYYVPFIRKDQELKVFTGPQIRKDWLDRLGLPIPATTDQLYETLKAFKAMGPDIIPMSGVQFENPDQGIGNLMWAFGTHYDFYVQDGSVKYGVLEDRFAEALSYIVKLYSEDLIDIDYIINDREKMDAKMMNDKVGFLYSLQPGKYYTSMNDGTRKVVGIPHLTGPYGDHNCFYADYANDVTNVSIAISAANENPTGTAKWLDTFFGEEGVQIMNFGREGETFTWEDGYPKLTDYILNNPDGKNLQDMAGLNLGTYQSNFPTLQDWRYYEQILTDWGRESIKTWKESADISGILPPVTFTEEENRKVTQIMSQVETYVSEEVNKIVVGRADISSLPQIRERVQLMGIDTVLDIYNAAYKRYQAR